jgi:serine/threonine protein kinase
MSPEHVLDKVYRCSSDLWSFGLVLLTCTTGDWNLIRDEDHLDKEISNDI